MRRQFAWLAAACVMAGVAWAGMSRAAEPIRVQQDETPEHRDQRMAWWRDARFGMFIHWGVYSVPAGFYHDAPVAGIGEWIMNRGRIPVAEYAEFTKQFNPVKFNADDWVRVAKEAGMKYIVITSKHHDGFAMYHSKASKYNIYDATPFRRDPLAELAAACRKQGVKLGFYYSQAQDWHHPGGAASGGHWDPAQDGDMLKYIETIAAPQVREILTNFGPDVPAVLWWDTPVNMTPEMSEKLLEVVRQCKPEIIMNNRLGGGVRGDTETPEQYIPATGFRGRDWETCMTMNNTWGFKRDDENWKTVETLIRNLIDIASKGGNYLLNVGPTSEGLIPAASVERLQAVGAWMRVNGEAIYGTTATPFPSLAWGRCTRKVDAAGTTLYLHVFQWPADGKLFVPGLNNQVEGAWLLADRAKAALPATLTEDGVLVRVPVQASDPIATVVVVRVKGDVAQQPFILQPNEKGELVLAPDGANIHGEKLITEGHGLKSNLGFWVNSADTAEWLAAVPADGRYTVTFQAASLKDSQLTLSSGGTSIVLRVAPATGDYKKYKQYKAEPLTLKAGKQVSLIAAPVKDGWQPVNLREIRLVPAK